MKKNMGKMDKLIRLFLVLAISLISYFNVVSGIFQYVLLGVAVILLLTSFLNFCPLYVPFGANTCNAEEKSEK